MANVSWRQFAAIPYNSTVSQVVRALAVEIPPEGRPRTFHGTEGFIAQRTADEAWVVLTGANSLPVDGPGAVIKAARLPAGTPSGDALREWLRLWGWVPKSEQKQQEPQEQTRTIV